MQTENIFCPECGSKQQGNAFCSKCGNQLVVDTHIEEPKNQKEDIPKAVIEENSEIEQQQINSLIDNNENNHTDDINKKSNPIFSFKGCFLLIIWGIFMIIVWLSDFNGTTSFLANSGALPNFIFWTFGGLLGGKIIGTVLHKKIDVKKATVFQTLNANARNFANELTKQVKIKKKYYIILGLIIGLFLILGYSNHEPKCYSVDYTKVDKRRNTFIRGGYTDIRAGFDAEEAVIKKYKNIYSNKLSESLNGNEMVKTSSQFKKYTTLNGSSFKDKKVALYEVSMEGKKYEVFIRYYVKNYKTWLFFNNCNTFREVLKIQPKP